MRVVWKIGGSVLARPELRQRVLDWQRLWTGSEMVWVVGGGVAADTVREWDRIHLLGDAAAHDLALSAMDFNSGLLCHLLPEASLVRNGLELEMTLASHRPAVLCAGSFFPWAEHESQKQLPRSWQLTSDSLAAWAARYVQAERLVLVKSIAIDADSSLLHLVQKGLVDPLFPEVLGTGTELWTVEPGTITPLRLIP
jgi:5-(aminomethyl)-3-furanmethanol phosphate kinase